MTKQSIADLRENYTKAGLKKSDVNTDPVEQFQLWFNEALEAGLPEPNAMTLATVTADGRPAARIVLLKALDQRGFVFYTNFQSRKGQELIATPWASLVFLWLPLERQVRIEGQVEKLNAAEMDEYFASRPRGSQLGAWASDQSEEVADREELEHNLSKLQSKYEGQTIPRPSHWGGFLVKPNLIEFWQGRPSRLHDRICYQKQTEGDWRLSRLAP